jgi:hypothetical protein
MRDMVLLAEEFERLHPSYQALIIKAKGIPVEEISLPEENVLVLYSLYNFYVEAVLDLADDEIRFIERLTLEQVVNTYCEDIPSI